MSSAFERLPQQKPVTAEKERETTFEAAAEAVRLAGYRFHEAAHDKEGQDPKTYHTSEHPQTLERRAEKMAGILGLSSEQLAVVKMAIAWHDTIIEYDRADPDNLLAMIRRHRGAREGDKPSGIDGNEGKSARLAGAEMRQANAREARAPFTEDQIDTVVWAIDATYPDVLLGADFQGAVFEEYPYYEIALEQNPALGELLGEMKAEGLEKGLLFFQPHLENPLEAGQAVPREVLITALADLGAAGFAGKEEFFQEGDAEMREVYANVRQPEVMQRLISGDEEADRADRAKTMQAWMGWLGSQPGFALWQSLRFEKIISLLKKSSSINPEEEQGLRGQFSQYPDNVRATRERAKEVGEVVERITSADGEKAAFAYLARTLGYEV